MKAAAIAAELAQADGSRIVVLHVLVRDHVSDNIKELARAEHLPGKGIESASDWVAGLPPELAESLRGRATIEDAQDDLERIGGWVVERTASALRAAGVERVETKVDDGDPAERILDHARAVSADMIVLGSRGLGNLKGAILGSVSNKIAVQAPCSVVTVR